VSQVTRTISRSALPAATPNRGPPWEFTAVYRPLLADWRFWQYPALAGRWTARCSRGDPQKYGARPGIFTASNRRWC